MKNKYFFKHIITGSTKCFKEKKSALIIGNISYQHNIPRLSLFWGPFPLSAGGMKTFHHFPEPDCDNPCTKSDDGGGFVGKIAAGRPVPFKGAPLRTRAGPKACTPCCHATVRQNPGYQTQLIHHFMIFQYPFQLWLPDCTQSSSLPQLCCKITFLTPTY